MYLILQGNARRLLDKRCDGNSRLGKISKLGLAPVLWCLIFVLLVTYTHSVIMGICLRFVSKKLKLFLSCHDYSNHGCFFTLAAALNMPKLTAGSGLFAWLGVFSASAGLVMLYRCSRYVSGRM